MVLLSQEEIAVKNIIVSISLAVALILSTGLIGCGGEEAPDIIEYNLTISSTEGGSVTAPGEGTYSYEEGEVVDLVADADEGYRFVNWTGDVDDIADVDDPTTTITMNGNYTITAEFETISPIQYSLTVSSTTGGVVTAPGSGMFAYDAGTVVNLVTAAEEGYYFINWTGDVSTVGNVNAASTVITMNGNYHITANFEQIPPIQYSLTITSTAGGSVTTPGDGTFTYDAATVVDLVAAPASGYRFDSWTGDVATLSCQCQSTTVIMNGNYSLVANFEAILPIQQYTLFINHYPTGGMVTIPGEGTFTYAAGTVVTLEATPISNHRFLEWTGDVGTIANINAATTTITMNGNYFITPVFWSVSNLTISSSAGGSVITPGEGVFTYDSMTVVSLVATPATGYRFLHWTGDVAGIGDVNAASTTIAVYNNPSITANFESVPPI